MIYFTIPGPAKGKGRPRFARRGNFVKTYAPETTVNYENWVKLCYQAAEQSSISGEIHAEIKCYFEIPKSFSKKKRESCLNKETKPTKKPDLSNIIKIVEDALNGLAYHDDSQIVELVATKDWSTNPRVEVTLREIKPTDYLGMQEEGANSPK